MRRIIPVAVLIATAFGAAPGSGQQTEPAEALPRDGATRTFSNELLDAWDVTWVVNVPTPMHRHAKDYFGVELTPSRTRLTAPDGAERTITLTRGRLWFLRAGVTHAETGLTDDPPRHAIIAWSTPGGPTEHRSFDAGEVLYLPQGVARTLHSEDGPARVIVAELKG